MLNGRFAFSICKNILYRCVSGQGLKPFILRVNALQQSLIFCGRPLNVVSTANNIKKKHLKMMDFKLDYSHIVLLKEKYFHHLF